MQQAKLLQCAQCLAPIRATAAIVTCRFCGYDNMLAAGDHERAPAKKDAGLDPKLALRPGMPLMILWGQSWYPGRVVHVLGDKAHISYDGWDSSWNETVTRDRLRVPSAAASYKAGDAVLIAYNGSYYPGEILAVKGASYRIRYDGYDESWDEDVGPERLQPA